MTTAEILAALHAAGTEQNRKVYMRHGVQMPMSGVSYAALKELAKKLKKKNDTARELWATGNHDARVLATMIFDPRALDSSTLDQWSADLNNYVITDAFAKMVGNTALVRDKEAAWIEDRREYVQQAGWILTGLLATAPRGPDDSFFQSRLALIRARIHAAPNRARHAMNAALISIGGRNDALESDAIATATAIGPVTVDHGQTGCETPSAVPYIRKMGERRRMKLV